ncbi:MAG TPA: alcohol dehydrogenase catalytic domain-containing protein [Bacteroidales bacterium]|nr:alcohol dehydrogenase catalytic domain-containing protein [Bacteroidales bacterium]
MRQAVMVSPGVIELHEVADLKQVAHNEVLMNVKRIGVCGSDIHVYHGKHPFTKYPIIQGHEYSGEVIKVGKDVTKVKPGMKITARPQLTCGTCAPCKRGDYNVCQKLRVEGFHANGCAQDYFVVTEDRVLVLPDSLSFDVAATVEPVSVAVHATGRGGDLYEKNVVVAGAGTIGNLVAQCAMAKGARKVLVTDLSEFRLNKAVESGIGFISNSGTESFEDAVTRVFGDEGFQVGFECAGVEITLQNLVNYIENGSRIVVVGVYSEFPKVNYNFVGEHELMIIGTLMYKHEDYGEAIRLLDKGVVKTNQLITNHFSFEEYTKAYNFIDEQGDRTLKVMIDL